MRKIFLKKHLFSLIKKRNNTFLETNNNAPVECLYRKSAIYLKFLFVYTLKNNNFLSLHETHTLKYLFSDLAPVNNNLHKVSKKINNNFVTYARGALQSELFNYSRTALENNHKSFIAPRNNKLKLNVLHSKIDFWSNFYSFLPFQALTGEKFTVINFNILNSTTKQIHSNLLKEALQVFSFLQLNRVAAHFTATIYTALMLKDSKALATFIRTLLREVHFKQHPFYFSFIGFLVRDIIQAQLHSFNCLGVSVVFRGKLGIGGNARKRALKYQTGMVSASSKYVKLSRSLDVIRTKTGIVGFAVIVAW